MSALAHILVADDEPLMRELVATMLQTAGYRVTTVEDGAPALAALSADGADFVALVSDCRMTRVHGPEVFQRLRGAGRDLPVVLMSGSEPADSISGLVADPKAAFLGKPFRAAALRDTLKLLLADGPLQKT